MGGGTGGGRLVFGPKQRFVRRDSVGVLAQRMRWLSDSRRAQVVLQIIMCRE